MNPAYSVIFFTTASGAGYGLLALIGFFNLFDLFPESRWFGISAMGTALILITAGLLSSTFHLGHPERAWRALSQWRTSWLAREGVASLFTYVPACLFGIGWLYLEQRTGVWAWIGITGAIGATATVFCTGMIYASLKAIPAWNDRRVIQVYLILGLATGALLLDSLLRLFAVYSIGVSALVMALLLLGAYLKYRYWHLMDTQSVQTSLASATGLGAGVQCLDPPHTGTNYLLTEMGYRIARKHAVVLRYIVFAMLFDVPLILHMFGLFGVANGFLLSLAAVLSAAVGVVIERWLFFAEAKHVMAIYYGVP